MFRLLSQHADVYMTPAKDLYYFDRYYHRGLDWYARQFSGGTGHRIIGLSTPTTVGTATR